MTTAFGAKMGASVPETNGAVGDHHYNGERLAAIDVDVPAVGNRFEKVTLRHGAEPSVAVRVDQNVAQNCVFLACKWGEAPS